MYYIKSLLEDIQTHTKDPFELHFMIDNQDDIISAALREDFNFVLKNKWIVSANNGNIFGQGGFGWYVRGSRNQRVGSKHYYNLSTGEYCNKKEFNDELLECAPNIKDREYGLIFNTETKDMRLNT